MKTTAKLMALCLMLASLGFAQGDTKKADDKKAPAATDTKKDDGMAKTDKKKSGKKGGKKGKKTSDSTTTPAPK